MKIGLSVSDVKNDPSNPTFSLRGYLYVDSDVPLYVWLSGYVGIGGKTLHISENQTFKVGVQAKILQYVAENEKKFLRTIKRKLQEK